MPVEHQHPQYRKYVESWQKCRAVIDGEDCIKDAGVKYLPALSGQTDQQYAAYNKRASFFAGTARTLDALVGMVFKNEMIVKFPESQKDLLDMITRDKKSLNVFAKQAVEEVFMTARYGVMVDMETDGLHPYVVGYTAESIINWRTRSIKGREVLDLVVLKEQVYQPADEFDTDPTEKLRVLRLDMQTNQYAVDLYIKRETADPVTKSQWMLSETFEPKIRGVRMDYIPFVIIGTKNLSPDVEKPPLLDMANINLSHFRSSADLEHGRHYTALPTPWAAGFDVKTSLHIGSSTAWIAEDPQATCGYLEYTGQGLGALENALKEKQGQMAVLGARLLETDKLAAEAADTHRIRRAGENNVVSSTADTVGEGLEVVLKWCAAWSGSADTDIEVELNKEYIDAEVTPEMMSALMAQVQAGLISWDTYFYNLKRGQIIPNDRDGEEEKSMIELGTPGGMGGLGPVPGEDTKKPAPGEKKPTETPPAGNKGNEGGNEE